MPQSVQVEAPQPTDPPTDAPAQQQTTPGLEPENPMPAAPVPIPVPVLVDTPAPVATPAPVPVATPAPAGVDVTALMMAAHNQKRAQHLNTPPVTWSADLAVAAQAWASQ